MMEASAAAKYETEDAYRESGCSNLTEFLSSPACRNYEEIVLRSNKFLPKWGDAQIFLNMDEVREREEGSFLRFLHTLPSSTTYLRIDQAEFESEEEVSALCQAIASPLCTLRHLELYGITCNDQAAALAAHAGLSKSRVLKGDLIAEALLHNTSLQSLTISAHLCSHKNFAPALMISRSTGSASSLKSLCIMFTDFHEIDDDASLLISLLTGLANNTISLDHLQIFRISGLPIVLNKQVERQLGQMILTNFSLMSLNLYRLTLSGEGVLELFSSLEKNLNLSSLSLWICDGEDWPSISTVLDSLRVNGIITHLDISFTPLDGQNDAAIKAQLAKNGANVEHVKVLKSQGSAQVEPTTVRLFLCGLPFSGKTTLSRSLASWDIKPSHYKSALHLKLQYNYKQQRTRGIEVTSLESKDGVQVSLWDMAGQREFYSFHDYMLPNLTDEATPSMFLFVWNPIQVDLSTGRELKDQHDQLVVKSMNSFREEFNYWLQFIASKTLKSTKFRPKVLVAITRADKKLTAKRWIKDNFHRCQEDFKDHLHLDIDGVFEVDARDAHNVKQLALHVFDGARSLLKAVPRVFKACDDARRLLSEVAHKNPLMTKDELFSLFHRRLGADSTGMQEAIAHSLNNSGDLIYFKSAQLVVVDVKWFCNHVMGSLLYFGMSTEKRLHQHGVFPLGCLEELLEEEANSTKYRPARGKHRKSFRFAFSSKKDKTTLHMQHGNSIKGEDLVRVLMELGLACQRSDGEPSSIFIPASLCRYPDRRSQFQLRQYLKGDREHIVTYMGRRLRCKNAVCTFFTPGFFPSLQVMFDDMFRHKHGVAVTLEEDVIAFAHGGVEVLMEFYQQEGERQFIDILIQSRMDFEHTIEWMQKEILENVEKVRARDRGLQGVDLEHEVVRPGCVKEFICLDQRKTQAISLEALRTSFRRHLEQNGSLLRFEDCLKNVFHTWQTDNNSDPLMNLLGNEETQRVVESFRQKFIIDVDNALGINLEREICSEKEPEKPEFSSSDMGLLYNKVEEVHQEVRAMRKDLQQIIKQMDHICSIVLPKLQQRMEELLKFSKEGEVGKLPRFFVVTKGKGKLREIVAAMVPGLNNVRLELLCEHQSGPHLVDDQCGLEFDTLGDGLLKSGLPYIITVLKVAHLAMRVGAHVVAGLGDAVPDFTRVLALIADTPTSLSLDTLSDASFRDSTFRTNFQEGQQWLLDILSKHKCSTSPRIYEVFGLTRVRCTDLRIKWLCDEHSSEGAICHI